ncbi:MAG TPA: AAA family ATPase, partial [Gemmata sp.]|nr:AAA family ATPase [Gemmata sp.]
MFKSIRLRNFKGYKDSREIPLGPLTVLIGKNNAGKSTIIHALLLLKQTLDDASNAALVTSGPLVELNGFYDILHRKQSASHDPSGHIGIEVKLTPPEIVGGEFGKRITKEGEKGELDSHY